MRFELDFAKTRPPKRREEDPPMRVLVLADLRGANADTAPPLSERSIRRVDIERFDDVFAAEQPAVALPELGLDAPLSFSSPDDLHPDELVEKVALFDHLKSLRARLQTPSTFAAAAAELLSDAPAQPTAPDQDAAAPEVSANNAGALLDRLLGGSKPAAEAAPVQRAAAAGLDALIKKAVAPHVVETDDPQLPQLLSAVDAGISDSMRAVLHAPAFQALEATWRGIQFLLARCDEGDVQLSVMHVARGELTSDALRRRLETSGAEAETWAVVIVDHSFGASSDDLTVAQHLGSMAGALGFPMVAAAEDSLMGCDDIATSDPNDWAPLSDDLAAAWSETRQGPGGKSLGLTWPRMILRLPYGKKTDPIDAFTFEEAPSGDRAHILWGSGAYAAAVVLAHAHLGAESAQGDVGDLPAFTYAKHGEPEMMPCAERFMTDRGVDAILARGIMPLASYKNRNAVKLVRLQSLGATAID